MKKQMSGCLGRNKAVTENVILNRGLYRLAAPRRVSVRGLIMGFEDLNRFLKQSKVEMLKRRPAGFQNAKREYGGFTLIELLVVVLIIGILASAALPQYEKAVMKSRYSTLMALTDSIANAEEAYYLANGEYTSDFEALALEPSGCTLSEDKSTCTYPWGGCRLMLEGASGVMCYNTQTLQNGYYRWLANAPGATLGSRGCISSRTGGLTSKYAKLCTSLGAVYFGHGGSSVFDEGSCIFPFP